MVRSIFQAPQETEYRFCSPRFSHLRGFPPNELREVPGLVAEDKVPDGRGEVHHLGVPAVDGGRDGHLVAVGVHVGHVDVLPGRVKARGEAVKAELMMKICLFSSSRGYR